MASIARAYCILPIGSALYGSVEGRQHPLHFPQLFLKPSNLVLVENAKRTGALELTVHLVRRCECNLEIPRELALTPLAGTFRDVVGDSVDGTEELGTETGAVPPIGRRKIAWWQATDSSWAFCQTLIRRKGCTQRK